ESYEQRQRPERRERRRADQRDGAFEDPTRARSWSREGRDDDERGRRGRMSGVSHGDRRQGDERKAPGRPRLILDPIDEGQREHGQQRPSEARGQHADVNAALHATGDSRRERESNEGKRQRQPTIADD